MSRLSILSLISHRTAAANFCLFDMRPLLIQALRSAGNLCNSSRHMSMRSIPMAPVIPMRTIGRCTFSTAQLIPGVGRGKTSTGLVGLAVDHEAVPKMIVKYQALLDRMEASDMPADAEYRKVMEKICRYRIKAAQENLNDPEKVEELCNCGQVEELVVQADNEMIVLEMYLKNRWWEYVKPIEVEYEPTLDGGEGGIEWDSKLEKNQ